MKCPKCQFDNPSDSKLCKKCATPLPPHEEIPVTEILVTPKEELTIGTTFAGRYEIIEELGKGGMGKVYRAEDKKVKEVVTLKLIKPEISSDKSTIERLKNELKMARKIVHRNVCKMYDLGEEEGQQYITMEYVPGEDLKSLKRRFGRLNPESAIKIAKQVSKGLSEAHKLGIVHCDLKPSNIMIDSEGNARIMDFGVARSIKEEGVKKEGVIFGTPGYMSPEQVEAKDVDNRSDIYSLGVILYEMVTGRVPFARETSLGIAMKHKIEMPKDPRELNSQIPEDLSYLILRCMKKDKKNRYQSAEEVRSKLELIEKGIPIIPRQRMILPPREEKARRTKEEKRRVWGERIRKAADGMKMGQERIRTEDDEMRMEKELIGAVEESTRKNENISELYDRLKQLGLAKPSKHDLERIRRISRDAILGRDIKEKEPGPRYVNVDLIDRITTKRCDPAMPLSISDEYSLRIDIGLFRDSSVVKDARKYPFPDHILKKGYWLDVIVTSEEFTIKREKHSLFLPKRGTSWICNCIHKGRHYCKPEERVQYLYVPVKSPITSCEATLRIGFYYRNNLLQSQLLTAQVGIEVSANKMGYESEIDYTITGDLKELTRFPARTLSIQTNENVDGSHRIILVGKKYISHRSLANKTIRDAMNSARQALHDTHRKLLSEAKIKVRPDGSEMVTKKAVYDNLLKELDSVTNAKNRDEFISDLKRLANLGSQLWETLFQRYPDSRRMLRDRLLKKRSPIQICRSKNTDSPMLFPWALIYDINLDSDSNKWQICELLNDWKPGKALIDLEAEKCPYDDGKNHRMDLICPFGFWGFKHTLEQPPSMPKGRDLTLKITLSEAKAKIAAGLSLNLHKPHDHIEELKKQLKNKVQIIVKDSKDDILMMLGNPHLEFVYIFCHGRRRKLPGTVQRIPYLEVGKRESITTGDIQKWQDNIWPVDHWTMTEPLVFINGCHTVELTPDSLVNFVDRFIEAGAGGVIGTEVAISQDLASEAALQLFSYLLENKGNVGQAIHWMRNHFLSKGNMMGLAYIPYCSANLHLE